jgi:hypothetical protein
MRKHLSFRNLLACLQTALYDGKKALDDAALLACL